MIRERGLSRSTSIRVLVADSIRASQSTIASWIEETEQKHPRLFNLLFMFILPFIALLCWSLLCGHILVLIESSGELERNNAAVAAYYNFKRDIFHHHRETAAMERLDQYQNYMVNCLNQFLNDRNSISSSLSSEAGLVNSTELMAFMTQNCTTSAEQLEVAAAPSHIVHFDIYNPPIDWYDTDLPEFNWNTCTKDGSKEILSKQQQFFIGQWNMSFVSLYDDFTINDGLDPDEAYTLAAAKASASEFCRINSSGGAVFWFTLMTTIGYGNSSPVTIGGQWFVMTFGLVSILMFTAVLGTIGYVSLAIADDGLKRCKMERMTRGWIAVLFWFCMLLSSMLTIAGIRQAYYYALGHHEDVTKEENFIESFWFSFATMTTVGFGDVYLAHETFRVCDIFIAPLFILMGFVCLANFLLKLSNHISELAVKKEIIPNNKSFRSILDDDRENDDDDDDLWETGNDGNHVTFITRNSYIVDNNEEKTPQNQLFPVGSKKKVGKVVTFYHDYEDNEEEDVQNQQGDLRDNYIVDNKEEKTPQNQLFPVGSKKKVGKVVTFYHDYEDNEEEDVQNQQGDLRDNYIVDNKEEKTPQNQLFPVKSKKSVTFYDDYEDNEAGDVQNQQGDSRNSYVVDNKEEKMPRDQIFPFKSKQKAGKVVSFYHDYEDNEEGDVQNQQGDSRDNYVHIVDNKEEKTPEDQLFPLKSKKKVGKVVTFYGNYTYEDNEEGDVQNHQGDESPVGKGEFVTTTST